MYAPTHTPIDVLVFRTDVSSIEQAIAIQSSLQNHPLIAHINFDLEDIDNILRIESKGIEAATVKALLHSKNVFCEELE